MNEEERDKKRFLKKVRKTDNCWIWIGQRDRDGYGRFWYNKKNKFAHRISYQWWRGPLYEEKVIMHKCDTPECVNPEHLSQGTIGDNNRDCIEKGRKNNFKGENNPKNKLTEYQVKRVKDFHTFGMSVTELSRTFNVSRKQIDNIIKGVHWKET